MRSRNSGITRPTLSTTIHERGDVVLVEFVFTNQREAKKRPGLILSTGEYNRTRDEVVLAAITSNLEHVRYGDTEVERWREAGLRLPSIVTGIVQTLKRNLVVQVLGTLDGDDLSRVDANLADALGFRAGDQDE